jgi:nucleotidyltransferase substrate binding protein (TIGR01987 family)
VDKLNIRLSKLNDALERFKKSLEIFKKTEEGSHLYTLIRDSVIQRFEFTFDIFWKCLKDVLSEKYKINIASPRFIFRESFTQQLITKQELEVFENMINDRNNTSHGYDEMMSEKIARKALSHYDYMINVSKKIKKQ